MHACTSQTNIYAACKAIDMKLVHGQKYVCKTSSRKVRDPKGFSNLAFTKLMEETELHKTKEPLLVQN